MLITTTLTGKTTTETINLKRIPVFGTSKELNEIFIVKKYVLDFTIIAYLATAASMPYALLEEEISVHT